MSSGEREENEGEGERAMEEEMETAGFPLFDDGDGSGAAFGNVFAPSEEPRHVGAAAAQALAQISAGVLGGVGTLIAAPVIGVREEGAIGLAKGLGAGIAGAVVLPVIGLACAAKSLAQGAANTPAAVQASAEGKEWDAEKNEWKLYDLREEAQKVLDPAAGDIFAERRRKRKQMRESALANDDSGDNNESSPMAKDRDSRPGGKKVKDDSLYQALNVNVDATEGQIKKAYYKQALKYHPDKNREPGAREKFQQIGRAYQILSNKAARRKYDELGDGEALADSEATMDASTFFAMVFGSEAFEMYVGELRLATTMKKSMQRESEAEEQVLSDIDADELAFEQKAREVRLAQILADELLQDLVDQKIPKEECVTSLRRKADELATTPFGATLLLVIARAYRTAGSRHLATAAADVGLFFQETAHDASTRLHVLRDAVKAVSSTRAAQKSDDDLARYQAAAAAATAETHTDPNESSQLDLVCEDAPSYQAKSAKLMLVHSDNNSSDEWRTRYFLRRTRGEGVYSQLPYSETAVLFERKDENEWWRPYKEYGYLDVEKIRIAVAEADPSTTTTAEDDSENSSEYCRTPPRNTPNTYPSSSTPPRNYTPQAAAESMSKLNHARMMAAVVEAAWRISVVDIDSTLKSVTRKLLTDHSVNEDTRRRRAEALITLADTFEAAVEANGHKEGDWQLQLSQQIRGMGVGFRQPPPTNEGTKSP